MSASSVEIRLDDAGGYDRLYAARHLLWPAVPGRMVRRAVELSGPGRALDAGCGDGKNAAFLLSLGWSVDAFDVSPLAVEACRRRLSRFDHGAGRIQRADCRTASIGTEAYDMVVAYGLYHCLDDAGLQQAHRRLTTALRQGGLFVCAAFDDGLPVPAGHGTGKLFPRPPRRLHGMFPGWRLVASEQGIIEEDHLPVVGHHRHSLTWAIYERPASWKS